MIAVGKHERKFCCPGRAHLRRFFAGGFMDQKFLRAFLSALHVPNVERHVLRCRELLFVMCRASQGTHGLIENSNAHSALHVMRIGNCPQYPPNEYSEFFSARNWGFKLFFMQFLPPPHWPISPMRIRFGVESYVCMTFVRRPAFLDLDSTRCELNIVGRKHTSRPTLGELRPIFG